MNERHDEQENKHENKHEKDREPLLNRAMSRRGVLTALGATGMMLAADHLFKGRLEQVKGQAETVSGSVYGPEGLKEEKLSPSMRGAFPLVIGVTLADLRGMAHPVPGIVYYMSDPGQEGHFRHDALDSSSPDNEGTVVVSAKSGARFKRVSAGALCVKWFGAKGDGMSDDTAAIRSALDAARGQSLHFPAGVYCLTNTITIPRNTFVRGDGNSSWFTFGQRRNEIPDSILDMESGTVLKFIGSGSTPYSSNRSDFSSFTCAVRLEADGDGVQISDLKILSSFRIRDELGHITTPDTDQHAMYDVGLWIDNATHVKLDRVSIVGYWQKAGLFLDASGRLASTAEFGSIEYATMKDSLFQGKIGMAVLGGDEGNPPDPTGFTAPIDDDRTEGQFGLSHLLVSDCFFSGTDHHSNGFAPGWRDRLAPDSTPIKIDGFIGSGVPYRINNPRFINCSIQTRESASIVLDRVIRPTFINCRAESGPVRASQYTIMPRLISCEFPYNRSNTAYQEIEHCPGALIEPPMRRLAHIHLKSYQFQIELRNNGGVIEHRLTKPDVINPDLARSSDIEALFRYAIEEAAWAYRSWSPLPIPGALEADDFSRGIYLGERTFISKYALYTAVAIDNYADYQEVEASITVNRSTNTAMWARPAAYRAEDVPYRIRGYSTVLKVELRSSSGPADSLLASLPSEPQGEPSLVIRVRGKFYEQGYGMA